MQPVARGRARGSRGGEPQRCARAWRHCRQCPSWARPLRGSAGDSSSRAPGHGRWVVPQRCQRRRFHQREAAAQDDREVQQLWSARTWQLGPQQGDRVAGGQGPRDWTQGPLGTVPALRLVSPHAFQAPTRSRHRGGGRAQRHQARWVEGERPRRGSGSLVQADLKEGRGRPARLPPADQPITAENCGRQGGHPRFPDRFASLRRCGSAPRALLDARPRGLHGLHAAVPRPRAHEELIAAGQAGAAGVVFTFDVPGKQVRGYYDPHVGTLYRVPAVFVGSAQATRLKALAAQGSSARVTVRAKVARKKTRNLIARLPGRSSEKIVLAANTDGNSWVQENGVIGMLAFARYYAKLPKRLPPPHAGAGVLERSRRVPRRRPDRALPPGQEEDRVCVHDRAPRYARNPADRRRRRPASEVHWPGRPGSVWRGRQRCPAPDGGRGDQAPTPPTDRGPQGTRGPEPEPSATDLLDGRPRQRISPEAWSRRWR